MEAIGPLQLRVMHYIWKHGPSTVHSVHDALNSELVWKTSADGTNWSEIRRAATQLTWQTARPELAGGTLTPEATPGEIVFDNFLLSR